GRYSHDDHRRLPSRCGLIRCGHFHHMRRLTFTLAITISLLLWPVTQFPALGSSFAWRTNQLSEATALVEQGISDHRMPGAVIWIEHEGASYHKAFGERALE